jgi:polyisoprenoid-binding protein YceI
LDHDDRGFTTLFPTSGISGAMPTTYQGRKELYMRPAEQVTAPALNALLENGELRGTWVLDPRRSHVGLKTRIIGLMPVNGAFGDVRGSGIVSPEGEVSGSVTVATASVDTKNKRRDRHLRSADFFDSDNYPDITFTVDAFRPSGGTTIIGMLTVRDSTVPLSFDAAVSVPANGEVWLDAEVQINRGNFGVTWNQLGLVPMKNILTVHTVFIRR